MKQFFASLATLDADRKQIVQRALWCAVTIVLIALSTWLMTTAQARQARRDLISNANNAITPASVSLEAFATQWRAQVTTTNDQWIVTWKSTDSRELRSSLLAFDTVNPTIAKSPRIAITKRDTSYNVSVEIAR